VFWFMRVQMQDYLQLMTEKVSSETG